MIVFAEIRRLSFSADGSCAFITFSLPGGAEEELCLLFEVYTAHVRGRCRFTEEEYSSIKDMEEYSRAVLAGLRSLACTFSTRAELDRKLRAKRFSQRAREGAINYFCERGYIKEKEIMVREIKACLRKKYGPLRIKRRLISRGFSSAMTEKGMQKLCGYDFTSVCLALAKKKAETLLLTDGWQRRMYSYLSSLGYAASDINYAVRSVEDEL